MQGSYSLGCRYYYLSPCCCRPELLSLRSLYKTVAVSPLYIVYRAKHFQPFLGRIQCLYPGVFTYIRQECIGPYTLMLSLYNLIEEQQINFARSAAALYQAYDPSYCPVRLIVTLAITALITNSLTMLVSAPYKMGVIMHLRQLTVAYPQQGKGSLGQ